jgi:multidrug efflux pump
MEPARQVRVNIDQDEARRLGVTSRAIAAVLNASVTGTTITQVRDDIYLVNVVARATEDQRASFASLSSLAVPTPTGRMVPLSQFARFAEEQEFPLVWRRDRVPTLTVRADVARGVLSETVVGALAPALDAYNAKLPRPYRIETGGTYESSKNSSANVFSVIPMMVLLMLLFMMILMSSFRRVAMVVFLLPLGLIGVVAALLVFQRPLGFVAILGILALIGMIAKNAVILIVSIESEREAGKSVVDAVYAAAKDRLTPLVLTAISTVLGLIPIAPTIFWGPMAIAIMGGLLVASLLTLILLPVLYITLFGREDAAKAAPRVAA